MADCFTQFLVACARGGVVRSANQFLARRLLHKGTLEERGVAFGKTGKAFDHAQRRVESNVPRFHLSDRCVRNIV